MKKNEWLHCPICKNKTRVMVRNDTAIECLPLYCPKCKQESLVNVNNFKIAIISEPDDKTQSQ